MIYHHPFFACVFLGATRSGSGGVVVVPTGDWS